MLFSNTPCAALRVDVLRAVARQARDDLDAVGGEERGQVLLCRLQEHRQVAAIDHAPAEPPRVRHEAAEARLQLGCAAGDVDERDRRLPLEQRHDALGDRRGHHLGALRARVDVAVMAGLVAALADVHLERRR